VERGKIWREKSMKYYVCEKCKHTMTEEELKKTLNRCSCCNNNTFKQLIKEDGVFKPNGHTATAAKHIITALESDDYGKAKENGY
jgi:NAD-dependent SIR2 family protein deacetylase